MSFITQCEFLLWSIKIFKTFLRVIFQDLLVLWMTSLLPASTHLLYTLFAFLPCWVLVYFPFHLWSVNPSCRSCFQHKTCSLKYFHICCTWGIATVASLAPSDSLISSFTLFMKLWYLMETKLKLLSYSNHKPSAVIDKPRSPPSVSQK